MENEDLYTALTIFLKLFKNRPNHLAKFLLDNNVLTEDIIKKLKNSDKLKKMRSDDIKEINNMNFKDISQMDNFYNSFIDDINQLYHNKNIEEITKELNDKLDKLVTEEEYIKAAKLRDYMKRNKIKRIN
ncbi:MAG: UvrB/UvrC motif-containing protein [Candidatus Muirbacterium halophilum]|nr:UvrB/UvrC motif-containing protein [Candidatus Muirbacterium halophilum]